jgi:tetratricopeptide (TPR) repeat protein
MAEAIASYNRALAHLRADSADIAQIALRKLVIHYPLFGPAAILYAACLAGQGRPAAAAELISRARLAGLRAEDIQLADALQEHLEDPSPSVPIPNLTASPQLAQTIGGSGILEKTKKTGKAKMASRREVRQVVRGGERLDPGETRVESKAAPGERLRRAVRLVSLAAGILILAGLITLLTRNGSAAPANTPPDNEARLQFLLTRLEALAATDNEARKLLSDYQTFVTPTEPAATPETAATETAPSTTAATTQTTPAPTTSLTEQTSATRAVDLLTQVYSEYQAALILAKTDKVTAAENLLQLSQTAAGLDPTLQSPAVPLSVGDLQRKIQAALDQYRVAAAEALRVQGSAAYDRKDYAASLNFYQRAYALNPKGYGGAIAYYCGRNLQALGQYEQARPYYEQVIAEFPGKQLSSYAAVRLGEMGFTPPTVATSATMPATAAPTTAAATTAPAAAPPTVTGTTPAAA